MISFFVDLPLLRNRILKPGISVYKCLFNNNKKHFYYLQIIFIMLC